MSKLSEAKMKKIAVTGNIGCGKSYVMNLIHSCGFPVLNLDDVARQVRTSMRTTVLTHFGCFNELELSKIVFHDEVKRRELEELLYPHILIEMDVFFEMHEDKDKVFVEVPLLFEKGWEQYFDEIWLVYASTDTCIHRLVYYRHLEYEEAQRRMAVQMSIEKKKKLSDVVIYNEDKDDVEKQIALLLRGK